MSLSDYNSTNQKPLLVRSIDEQGYGEAVRPEMEKPDIFNDDPEAHQGAINMWDYIVSTLPIAAIIHPSFGSKQGDWITEWVEGCQFWEGMNDMKEGEWKSVSKEKYEGYCKDFPMFSRIVLLPVQGKGEINETHPLYNKFKDALNIRNDMRPGANPFVIACIEIAEAYTEQECKEAYQNGLDVGLSSTLPTTSPSIDPNTRKFTLDEMNECYDAGESRGHALMNNELSEKQYFGGYMKQKFNIDLI